MPCTSHSVSDQGLSAHPSLFHLKHLADLSCRGHSQLPEVQGKDYWLPGQWDVTVKGQVEVLSGPGTTSGCGHMAVPFSDQEGYLPRSVAVRRWRKAEQ